VLAQGAEDVPATGTAVLATGTDVPATRTDVPAAGIDVRATRSDAPASQEHMYMPAT
jgi:hypothetical protein